MLLRDLRVVARAGGIDTLFLDKTGTLTEGRPKVQALYPVDGVGASELLATAAFIEREIPPPLRPRHRQGGKGSRCGRRRW